MPSAFAAGNFGQGTAERAAGNVLEPAADGGPVEGGWRAGRRGELRRALAAAAAGFVHGVWRGGRSGG